MKLAAGRVEGFLRQPDPGIRAVLLYGPDAGLVRERADVLGRAVVSDLHDPFRVADLTAATLAADPARLYDEAAQISLMGGRRLVRVRDIGDAQSAIFGRFLADPPGDGLVVIEAGDLPARAALRRLFDDAPCGVVIGCYPDNARDLAEVIRDTLAAHRIAASRDALAFLVAHLGSDRLLSRAELEKLTLYAGDGGRVEIEDAQLSIADSAALSLDDAVLAAAEGNSAALERALSRVFQEGESPVSVIRAALRHMQRLHALSARTAAGDSVDDVLRSARPPIFFKQHDSFRRQLAQWREPQLRRQLDALAEAETQLKTTGIPAETACRAALFAMAQESRPTPRATAPAIDRADRGSRNAR
ncbi:MAG TPA: DNA polymerase III subunit delta [Stellaceae bacterium]|nr:DNA polymerase III subunit delta [Stellaceae bacterium]